MEFCLQKVPHCLPKTSACISLLKLTEARHPLLIRWKESQALSSLLFVSAIAAVVRTIVVFLLPLLNSDFPQSQSAQLQQRLSTEEDKQPLRFIFERIKAEISLDRILFYYESRHMLLMTTAASCKTYLDAIMISRCQVDDTLSPFNQWEFSVSAEKRAIHFFQKMSTAPLFFSVPTPYPVGSSVLR